jgi:hypothetical protein
VSGPHKHAEVIKAWADGAEIEYRTPFIGAWSHFPTDMSNPNTYPRWDEAVEYRVLDDKRHLREAQAAGKWLEYNQGTPEFPIWQFSDGGLAFVLPVDHYRVHQKQKFRDAYAAGETIEFNAADADAQAKFPGTGWVEVTADLDELLKMWPQEHFRIALPWQEERDAQARGEQIWYQSNPEDVWLPLPEHTEFTGQGQYRVAPKVEHLVWPVSIVYRPNSGSGVLRGGAELDVTYVDGRITNITVKDWHVS